MNATETIYIDIF